MTLSSESFIELSIQTQHQPNVFTSVMYPDLWLVTMMLHLLILTSTPTACAICLSINHSSGIYNNLISYRKHRGHDLGDLESYRPHTVSTKSWYLLLVLVCCFIHLLSVSLKSVRFKYMTLKSSLKSACAVETGCKTPQIYIKPLFTVKWWKNKFSPEEEPPTYYLNHLNKTHFFFIE